MGREFLMGVGNDVSSYCKKRCILVFDLWVPNCKYNFGGMQYTQLPCTFVCLQFFMKDRYCLARYQINLK